MICSELFWQLPITDSYEDMNEYPIPQKKSFIRIWRMWTFSKGVQDYFYVQ